MPSSRIAVCSSCPTGGSRGRCCPRSSLRSRPSTTSTGTVSALVIRETLTFSWNGESERGIGISHQHGKRYGGVLGHFRHAVSPAEATSPMWAIYDAMPAHMRIAILLGALSGLRVAEVSGLRPDEDIDSCTASCRGIHVSRPASLPRVDAHRERHEHQSRASADAARQREDHARHLRHLWPDTDESTRQAIAERVDSNSAVAYRQPESGVNALVRLTRRSRARTHTGADAGSPARFRFRA